MRLDFNLSTTQLSLLAFQQDCDSKLKDTAMRATGGSPFEPSDLEIRDAASKNAVATLTRLCAIEKKTFPANEMFDFNVGLLQKQNTIILCASFQSDARGSPVAYAVYVRWRGLILLHKLCVKGEFRGRGIGRIMMLEVMSRARDARSNAIELWVDESRIIARGLYSSCGFKAIQCVQDYYGPRRHGIKMRFDLLG